MANFPEPSSSLSFTSSSYVSNGSIGNHISTSFNHEVRPSLEEISLNKLSSNLEQLLIDSGCDYSDADIVVEGIPVGVHRCILAVRSKFFRELFKKEKGSKEEGKPKYYMSDLLSHGKVGHEAFLIFLSYIYTAKLKQSPMEVSTCVDDGCAHDACRPAINFAVELMYASSIFQVPELTSLFQRRLLNFVEKAYVEDVIPILEVGFHCQSDQLVDQCVDRIARSDLDNMSVEKELPYEVAEKIKLLRRKFVADVADDENNTADLVPLHEKRIRRIHKALDSDDVELVKLLLTESDVTLDDAYALHYAAAYCDPKVVSEVLGLGLADVNRRNSRGYTVLHVAAMRRELRVIVSLLDRGACASDVTLDQQNAAIICRKLTRPKDYLAKTEQGQEANKYRLCIDVLEREMRRSPMSVDAATDHPMADDLMRLQYLEDRVAFARLFFPAEAKLAMDIAQADVMSEFSDLRSKVSGGNFRKVDLNETPSMRTKKFLARLEELKKTVEKGRRFFPSCSDVLDKFMDDDLPDFIYLEKGTPDEQKLKRTRFMELKEDVQKAFNKDKNAHRSDLSSSSSSSSLKDGVNHKHRKL